MTDTSPFGGIRETRQRLRLDNNQAFIGVINNGALRLEQGLPPVLSYKDAPNPTDALWLARAEWVTRYFIGVQKLGTCIMTDLAYVAPHHFKVFVRQWTYGLVLIKDIRDLACEIMRSGNPETTILEVDMNNVVLHIKWSTNPQRMFEAWQSALDNGSVGPIGPRTPYAR
jgi:hypothetical protein